METSMDMHCILFPVLLFPTTSGLLSATFHSLILTYYSMQRILKTISQKYPQAYSLLLTTIGCVWVVNTIIFPLFVLAQLVNPRHFPKLMEFSLFHLMGILLLTALSYVTYFTFSSVTKQFPSWITGIFLLLGRLVLSIMLWVVGFMALQQFWILVRPILTT